MKKIMLMAACSAALIFASCGGEKKDEKKTEEKKVVTEETKAKFDALRIEFANVEGTVSTIDGALTSYDVAKQSSYLDSLKTVAGKAKKDVKEKALPLIDSLVALNAQVEEWKAIFATEKETWGAITEDFTKVCTQIEGGEAADDEIAPRAEGFTEQFNYKKETLAGILANWNKLDAKKAELNALFAPATK